MSKSDDDDALLAAFTAEMTLTEAPITFVLRPVVAFQIAALLQLAIRHPRAGARVGSSGRLFIEHVREYFRDWPAISAVLIQGDHLSARDPPPIRLRYRLRGTHVHCRLFVDSGLAGALVFGADEWPEIRQRLGADACELLDEDDPT